jgi:hypothetical protein
MAEVTSSEKQKDKIKGAVRTWEVIKLDLSIWGDHNMKKKMVRKNYLSMIFNEKHPMTSKWIIGVELCL